VTVFAYSAGQVNDWVTAAIRQACVLRDVAALDDAALADQIRRDEIDVLVDLSGHTGGSRLTVFGHRPAPVQVSWLGYFATTGLPVIDAVLLDDWHAPPEMEEQFVESIVRLPGGRFCYTPVPFAPSDVAPPPCIAKGYVTFGCFNNTAKLNANVYEAWARILAAVPDSRLLLKWRTFQDEALRRSVWDIFGKLGIAADRIELRGASFHADVLKEYADIDIALDPFPFTGGLTSCEALWMGVPVVTWPQSQVVSRQTFAFLSAIGLPELAGRSSDDYVRIAVELAQDRERLQALRFGMRQRMLASPLCDVKGFTRTLEDTLLALAQRIAGNPD
jgi:predicted O-linked N-acetylglucosamine transferase (SPINDLY family)